MAINFPDTPSLNDEFAVGDRVWFWNGNVWKSKETSILETGKYIVSETAPTNPEEGDAWFDSVRTKEFIYYDGFWIETSAAAVGIPALGLATESYVDEAISDFAVTNQSVSSDIELEANTRYFVDTSVARTVSLPETPALGQEIVLIDATNLAATNNVIVNNNGNKIDGIAEAIVIDVDAFVVNFIYTGSVYGWKVI